MTPAERKAAQERTRELAERAYRGYRRMWWWFAARVALYAAAGALGALAVHWIF